MGEHTRSSITASGEIPARNEACDLGRRKIGQLASMRLFVGGVGRRSGRMVIRDRALGKGRDGHAGIIAIGYGWGHVVPSLGGIDVGIHRISRMGRPECLRVYPGTNSFDNGRIGSVLLGQALVGRVRGVGTLRISRNMSFGLLQIRQNSPHLFPRAL